MLAKTQNLFDLEEEFTPTEFAPSNNSGNPKKGFAQEKPDFFVLPSRVWETIQSDKEFAAELKKVIEQEVDKRAGQAVAKRLAEYETTLAQKQAEKEKEGFEEGLKRADIELEKSKAELFRQAEDVKRDLQQQIQNFISEKQRLLREHQSVWVDSISLVMKKFLVKNAGRVEAGISHWLETQVTNFASTEKLRVFVPEAQFKKMEEFGISPSAVEFEIVKDGKLQEGEFKVESSSGGVFFSAQEELKKLEDLLSDLGCMEEVESA